MTDNHKTSIEHMESDYCEETNYAKVDETR
jgi:hypothetical protein